MPGECSNRLQMTLEAVASATVLTAHGVLDSKTYLSLRDHIIKAAIDEPQAVIVDFTDLAVPAESALSVFTSARWHVGTWPEVPILLVCRRAEGRAAITRNGVSRYVPVYASTEDAISELVQLGPPVRRRRARAELPVTADSLQRSRELIEEWLTAWSQTDLIPAAKVIVTTLVENVLQHTQGPPDVRLETDGATVTVAVSDCSRVLAAPHETSSYRRGVSGLHIISGLCRVWGNAPTPAGKTVWAVIGPENRL